MAPWAQYVIAFIVFCHGFIYVRIGAVLPGPVKDWQGSSWLLGRAVTEPRLTGLVVGLHVIAGAAFLAAALAIGFASVVPGWWRPLAIVGSAIGIVAFAVFWDGQTRLLVEEGAIGAVVSLVLLAGAILFPEAFRS